MIYTSGLKCPSIFLNSIFPLLLCWVGYIVVFTKVLTMYQLYPTWIHPVLAPLNSPSPPIPGIVSASIIFAFTCLWTHFLHCIHPSAGFPCHLSSPTGASPPPWAGSICFPVLWFRRREKIKRKTWHFCLFAIKAAIQGVFLWYFHVYVVYLQLVYLLWLCTFYFSPFLKVVWSGLRFLESFLYREYITHIQVLSFLFLP
jgi:hypothetical protein